VITDSAQHHFVRRIENFAARRAHVCRSGFQNNEDALGLEECTHGCRGLSRRLPTEDDLSKSSFAVAINAHTFRRWEFSPIAPSLVIEPLNTIRPSSSQGPASVLPIRRPGGKFTIIRTTPRLVETALKASSSLSSDPMGWKRRHVLRWRAHAHSDVNSTWTHRRSSSSRLKPPQ
jgi:hypothetical protein